MTGGGTAMILRASVRAQRWATTVGVLIGCAVVAAITGQLSVGVPWVDDTVPVWTLLSTAVSTVVLPPLASSFPELEPTLLRERRRRALRCVLVVVMAAAALIPSYVSYPPGPARHTLLVFTALLLAVGVIGVALIGEWAWVLPLAAGLVAIVANGGMAMPIATFVYRIPQWLAVVVCLLAGAFQTWRGPRGPSRRA